MSDNNDMSAAAKAAINSPPKRWLYGRYSTELRMRKIDRKGFKFATSRLTPFRQSISQVERQAKNQGVSQGVNGYHKLGSILGPDSAEHPLKPHYKTQSRAKRCNRLDNRNGFGTRGSEVQILSPRPFIPSEFKILARAGDSLLTLKRGTMGTIRQFFLHCKPETLGHFAFVLIAEMGVARRSL